MFKQKVGQAQESPATGETLTAVQMAANLAKSQIAMNEASAVGCLRTINTSEVTYASTYNAGYAPALAALGPPVSGGANPESANLIDSELAQGTKSGYVFTYILGEPDRNGRIGSSYSLRADPVTPGITGTNHYFTDQTGVIRVEVGREADSSSSPISD